MNIFLFEFKSGWKSVLGWFVGLLALSMVMLAGGIFGMITGLSILTRENRAKTSDFLLTKPATRGSVIAQKLMAVLCSFIIINVVFTVTSIFWSEIFGGGTAGFSVSKVVLMSMTLFFIQLAFGAFGVFIAVFFRNRSVTDAIHEHLKKRDGLILGICNGFQALIKLGLVPFGEILPPDAGYPTLTRNIIGRHAAGYVYTRVASVNSPWMSLCGVNDVHTIAISHGEGRFIASGKMLRQLAADGRIATQYTDADGEPSMDISVNPNGSMLAVEGLFSPDGRVFGKMGHTERRGEFVAKNIYGEKHQPVFESGVKYFT